MTDTRRGVRLRSGPLAEARGQIRALEDEGKRHRLDCAECKPAHPCADQRPRSAELRQLRADVATWCEPGDDQERLPL